MVTDPTAIELGTWLNSLRRHDPFLRQFGAAIHRYEMNPCIQSDELELAEAVLGTRIPEDYRQFLLTCGNGGAGPGYGILSLAASIREFGNDPPSSAGIVFEPTLSAELKQVNRAYPDNGILPIANVGCGHMWVLITSGPERGSIWGYEAGGDYEPESASHPDYSLAVTVEDRLRANDRLLDTLLADPATRLTFWKWYQAWVHRTLLQEPPPRTR
ncbi:SMI1/KNR4 family protein [Paludibaculum fermentans]|uniref:SMI1/KNR4 family protein n=1 Tax=Paludibaculum fermentans TaxID=1473598 RepID=A0A7S7SN07_PALFE|nr:SMI1/KNR4 family protein [Paludibaculum fermentans]QOY90969.1 SMI1/KNR4 family protein [Paludibaculum fermentans]